VPSQDGGKRVTVSLACEECKGRNYKTTKIPDRVHEGPADAPPKRIELKKICKACKKTTVHRETK